MGINGFFTDMYNSVIEAPQSWERFANLSDKGLGATARNVILAAFGAGIISGLVLGSPFTAFIIGVSAAGLAFLYNTRQYDKTGTAIKELPGQIAGGASQLLDKVANRLRNKPEQQQEKPKPIRDFDVALGKALRENLLYIGLPINVRG